MSPRARSVTGIVLLALGACLLGFTLFGSITELATEESFEGGLEGLLAIWWLLVPAGVAMMAAGIALLWARRTRGIPPSGDGTAPPS